MIILVDIGHPAHVHLFKNMIWNLEENGHEVKITATDKEVALYLLNAYGFKYENLGKHYKTRFNKLLGLITRDYKLLKLARKCKPNIFISHGSSHAAQVAKLLGKPHISLEDTEHSTFISYAPFTDVILTSTCFKKDLGKKQVRYNGYHELAYLHPNYFKPDPSILDSLGLTKEDKFVIVRFVSWEASHDIKQRGFDLEIKEELIKEIEKRAQIFITSEKVLSKHFEKYRVTIPPEKMHDLLYHATMYIGEGATMASEAAVLGTPAIYVNTQRLGYLDEQEERYGLVYNLTDPKTAQERAIELLADEDLKKKWQKKREKLLGEKIDVTEFMTEFIENYPESFKEYG